jgi:hypothetical protein
MQTIDESELSVVDTSLDGFAAALDDDNGGDQQQHQRQQQDQDDESSEDALCCNLESSFIRLLASLAKAKRYVNTSCLGINVR